MRSTYVYTSLSLITILLFYIVPYTILRDSKGLVLVTYWSLLTLVWIVITLLYIRRW